MTNNRSKTAQLNMIVSLGEQMVAIVCGLIVPRLMISSFGSETYGAVSSITQFLAYITLLEGGIGGVARAALYKPLAEHDTAKISAIMTEIQKFFRIVAYIFMLYVLIVACLYKSFSGIQSLDWMSSFMLVLAISISKFGEYFIGISNSILLQAAQRSYIKHAISIFITIVNTLAIILLIQAGCGIILVKLISSIVFILRPVFQWFYVNKYYKFTKEFHNEESYLHHKWSGLGQHIAYFLHSNVDIVILTFCNNLRGVAVYSVYQLIVANMQKITVSFTSGMEALFGDMLAKEEYDKLDEVFGYYETLISFVTTILFSITSVLLVPFVKLYTVDINDAEYIEPIFAVLLVLAAILYCLRLPYHAMIIAAGHFKQTSKASYMEVFLNIFLSVILVIPFGLSGIALGTAVATAFRFIFYAFYLSKNIIYRRFTYFIKRSFVNGFSCVIVFFLGNVLLLNKSIENYWQWVVVAVPVGLMTILVIVTINALFYYKELKLVTKKFIKKR